MHRRRPAACLAAVSLAALGLQAVVGAGPAAAADRLDGFTAAHSTAERQAEQAFQTYPSRTLARALDRQLAAKTAMVGTPNDKARAEQIAALMRSFGLQPHISTFYVYMSSPRTVSLDLTAPEQFHASNKEACRSVETDCQDVVVGYNALSPSGDVTAPVVYVNYGTTDDYAALARAGVSVKGKIVLARYGRVYRGVKTNLAAAHGAKAAILYSDPADDGDTRGPVYPNGPWRAPDGIQRGSVQQLWLYGGDPLTPGRPATRNAKRIDPAQANLAKIPTLPISYASAQPFLEHLGGPAAPAGFQGGLPLTYRLGSGSTAHLKLDIDYSIKPVYDVTASIAGTVHPDEVVQIGAHHDAWTYGSDDNLSGAESVLQIARALAKLRATGWQPSRTIDLHTWDGEEYGLFGSTEYAEGQGRSTLGKVVGYLNMDGAAGQDFGATGVPSMDTLIRDVAKEVTWPGTGGTAYDNWAENTKTAVPTPDRLGSGSDYTSFFDHFGVPSADIGSGTPSGDYHCACDNFYMEDHFIDPGWKFHVATARVVGLAVMRLADSDVVPLHYTPYADEVGTYLNELSAEQDETFGRELLDLDRDKAQAQQWSAAATALDTRIDAALSDDASPGALDALTASLEAVERQLLVPSGLPGRPWFEHQIYAPGVNQGYGTQELPGLHDSLFGGVDAPSLDQARQYEATLYRSLQAATSSLT